jgi:hypothetical protein
MSRVARENQPGRSKSKKGKKNFFSTKRTFWVLFSFLVAVGKTKYQSVIKIGDNFSNPFIGHLCFFKTPFPLLSVCQTHTSAFAELLQRSVCIRFFAFFVSPNFG